MTDRPSQDPHYVPFMDSRVSLDDEAIHIQPYGAMSRLSHGTATRSIRYEDITAIELWPRTVMHNGAVKVVGPDGRTELIFTKTQMDDADKVIARLRALVPHAATSTKGSKAALPLTGAPQKSKEEKRAERHDDRFVSGAALDKGRVLDPDKAWSQGAEANADVDTDRAARVLLDGELAEAHEAAVAGNIVEEERHIRSALALGAQFSKGSRSIPKQEVERRSGTLIRIGSTVLSSFGFFPKTVIRSDRILEDDETFPFDGNTTATVDVDGEVLVRRSGGPTHYLEWNPDHKQDNRKASLTITGNGWSRTYKQKPDNLVQPRQVAARINAAAAALRQKTGKQAAAKPAETTPIPISSLTDELTKIRDMVESGFLTADEGADMKRRLLG